jgi:putative ABC transport system substrate-binding protein
VVEGLLLTATNSRTRPVAVIPLNALSDSNAAHTGGSRGASTAYPTGNACRERRLGPSVELSRLPRGDSQPPYAEMPRTTITDVIRRNVLLGSSVCLLAGVSTAARGQPSRTTPPRVAVLAPSTWSREEVTLKPFFDEMRRLGWVEHQTIVYDRAYGDDVQANLVRLAVEVVARKPDLIFAPPSPAAVAARKATSTIPVIFATGTDPVGTGLVASLARPGGNVTGMLSVVESLTPKLMQVLREVLPSAKRLGFLNDPNDPRARIDLAAGKQAAAAMGMTLVVSDAASDTTLSAAVARLADEKVDAIVTSTSLIFNLRVHLLELASARRVPVVGHRSELADAGALLTYGGALSDQLRHAAVMVDKVLQGSSPSALPVQQPTKFELVVNLRAARALGVKVPRSIVLRADRVIE